MSLPIEEEWRPVPGFNGYEASDQGRVRSFRRRPNGRVLTSRARSNGYHYVSVTRDDGETPCNVHRLVALAFLGKRPEGQQIRHLDGDKNNNAASNLAYGTQSDNELDKRRNGTNWPGNKAHCPKNHPYDEVNTRVARSGWRHCRTCERIRDRRRDRSDRRLGASRKSGQ